MSPRRLCSPWLLLVLPTALSAVERPATEKPRPADKSGWVFSLLPKSLQSNPRLELTVITEMTDEGRKRPAVTPERPAFIEVFSAGPRHLGHAQGSEGAAKAADIERVLLRSLATNGYLPARPPAQPPSVLVLYTWGAHFLLTEGDEENTVLSGEQVARNLLDRAALVGGEKFARDLLQAFEQADAMSVSVSAHLPPGAEPVMTASAFEFANPVNLFKRRSIKNESLVDQAASDVYYVVASAYDYASVAAGHRVLLWRTRMTVAAAGVSSEQSLPTLVLAAAPYFGREMAEAEVLSKRALREGKVEVGTPTVVESPKPSK